MPLAKFELYSRYSEWSVALYDATTVGHYGLGAAGIYLAYGLGWPADLFGSLYLAFALAQMYVLMPLMVCPNCVYCRLEGLPCPSGMDVVSRRFARQGDLERFGDCSKGVFCHNNLYMAALFIPVPAIIPRLVIAFSVAALAMLLGVVALLAFRMFVLFPKISCRHCRAKRNCSNAQSMGIADL